MWKMNKPVEKLPLCFTCNAEYMIHAWKTTGRVESKENGIYHPILIIYQKYQ